MRLCVQVVRLIEVLSVRKIRSSSLLEETGADITAEVRLVHHSEPFRLLQG